MVHEHVIGSFKSRADVLAFAKDCDVITVEIEHVDTAVLQDVEAQGIPVRPSPSTIAIIQDKHRQKLHLQSFNIALADFCACPTLKDMEAAGQKFGYPFVCGRIPASSSPRQILKSKFGAYDGRGNYVVKFPQDIETACKLLGEKDLYAERMVLFSTLLLLTDFDCAR